jgi:pimeloyl-ACP methyl ester carboxylesterase
MRRLSCSTALLIAFAGSSPAALATLTPDAQAIVWRTCLADETGVDLPTLGERLQCGTMRVPLDHNHPSSAEVDIGLIRVRAIDEAHREGALFFNVGGPGGNPRKFVPLVADWWSTIDPADPDAGDLRRVADRYDLMAVVPRGLEGGQVYDCAATHKRVPFTNLSADLSDANWRAAERDALAMIADCTEDPFHRFVNTEQHVHDMEFARRLFGDAPLNFYGTSYGTWVGAWYGAMYPEKVGRMLFDSTMDFTTDFAFAVFSQVRGAHDLFMTQALRPAVDAPDAYALGTDEDALLQRVRTMPARARTAWTSRLDDPASLAAALTMAEWIKAAPAIDTGGLTVRIAGHTFSREAEANARIRVAANALVPSYGEEDPSGVEDILGTDGISVNQAVICNDTPWRKGAFYWRTVALNAAQHFPGGSGSEAHGALICSGWPASGTTRPQLAKLGRAAPFLMIHAEFDRVTSLADALVVLDSYNSPHMVISRGTAGHGVLVPTASSCILRAAGSYLLTGDMPGQKLTDCEASPSRMRRSLTTPRKEVSQRLTELLERS